MSGLDLGSLADLLACPECHSQLAVVAQSFVCTGRECRLSFPVRDGIPVLLVDEAETLEEPDWQTAVGDLLEAEDDVAAEEYQVEPENES